LTLQGPPAARFAGGRGLLSARGSGGRRDGASPRREATGSDSAKTVIELTVADPQLLFHSLDPAPLLGRDLDDRVERYIIECAQERLSSRYEMILHLSGPLLPEAQVDEIAKAIRAYFKYREKVAARRLRLLVREGWQALSIGLAFLFLCGTLGFLATNAVAAPFGSFLNEGLLIIGWVANWRPVEIFLYDLRPLRRDRELLATLAQMQVRQRPIEL
jgi:hypothetical protein